MTTFYSCQNCIEKKIYVIYGQCFDGSKKIFGFTGSKETVCRMCALYSKDKNYSMYEFAFFEIDLIDELTFRV